MNKKVILVHGSFSPAMIAGRFPGTPWIFFDHGYLNRMKWERVLGADLKIDYKEDLSDISRTLRDKFVEWSSSLGRPHWGKWYWWITRLAGRNNIISRLYLYICYIEVLKRRLPVIDRSLIIISNSWNLLDAIEGYLRPRTMIIKPHVLDIMVRRSLYYFKEKLFFIAAWTIFFFRSAHELIAARLTRLGSSAKDIVYDKDHIVIHTCVDDGCMEDDKKFNDRYFTGLADYLREKGAKVSTLVWLYSIRNKDLFSVFRWFRENEESFLIPQDYYNLFDCIYSFYIIVISSMFRFTSEASRFRGTDISRLIRAEQVLQARDTGTAAFISRIKMFRKLKRMGYGLKIYADMWELKNCEVEAIIGIRSYFPECKIVGYQHVALVSKLLFSNYKTTVEEFNASPHADTAFTGSRRNRDFMINEGFPKEFIRMGPALRHQWLKKYIARENSADEREGLLVCLSLSYDASAEMLEMVHKVFANNTDHKIWIKAHPMMDINRLRRSLSFAWPAHFIVVGGGIETWLNRSNTVITSLSTAMVDSVCLGLNTVVIGRQTDIDIIPLDIVEDGDIWRVVYSHEELASAIDSFSVSKVDRTQGHIGNFFEFDIELLEEIFN